MNQRKPAPLTLAGRGMKLGMEPVVMSGNPNGDDEKIFDKRLDPKWQYNLSASEGLTGNSGPVVTWPMAPQHTCSRKPGYPASATLD